MTLTEFLLARIAEDEAVADSLSRGGLSYLAPTYAPGLGTVAVSGRDRLLAECESKRQIMERVEYIIDNEDRMGGYGEDLLSLLALPYADHPDYRDEWKP